MAYPKNALIVDDEPHVCVFLKLLLREVGIQECWEAGDGATALQLVKEHHPELVLLDVNMPGMSGLQLLAQFQAAGFTNPVVMVTSQSAIATVQEALRLGASGYLLKHVPKDETLKGLREVLDSVSGDVV